MASPSSPPGEGTARIITPLAAQPPPPRSAAYSHRGWSASSPVVASRRSARLDAAHPEGRPALPIPERAQLRAAARNLEPGTPSAPPSTSSCSFSALVSVPLGHLAKVASDSAIIFRGEVGPPLAQVAAIRAREVLDGKLAEARAALAVPPAPALTRGSAPPLLGRGRRLPLPRGPGRRSGDAPAPARRLFERLARPVSWGQAAPQWFLDASPLLEHPRLRP